MATVVRRARARARRGTQRAGAPPSAAGRLAAQAEQALERADGKAGALAATATAILLFAAQSDVRAACAAGRTGGVGAAALAAGGACWAAGIVALAAVIFPRFTGRREPDARWLDSIPGSFDASEISALVRRLDSDPERWQLAQARALGRIAMKKYRFIRIGMVLLGLGAALGLCGQLLG